MADVTRRMLDLLSTLQTGRSFSSDELSRRLAVSPRTLRRDVDRLREYGYPVETQPGPGGYYRLTAGRTMPPLVLDDDEAVAALFALATLGSLGPSTDGGIDDAATRAYGKLDQFLPTRLRPRAAAIRASLETSNQPAPRVDAASIALVADAIAEQDTVTFSYIDARGERTDRRVEPHRQVHHLLRWYLLGWDADRDDWRVFRLDRVTDVERTGVVFRPRPLPADSAVDYLRQGLNKGRQMVQLRVAAPVGDVVDVLKFQDAEIHHVDDGHTDVSLALDTWQWLVLNLAFLDTDFEIIAGREFREACRTFGRRLVDATSSPT